MDNSIIEKVFIMKKEKIIQSFSNITHPLFKNFQTNISLKGEKIPRNLTLNSFSVCTLITSTGKSSHNTDPLK